MPLPPQNTTISPSLRPAVLVLSCSKGYWTVETLSSSLSNSHVSSPKIIPSGLNTGACHIASITSPPLPATNISLASFIGSLAILALFGLNNEAHFFAEERPTSSLSKQKTTVSNFSIHSILFLISFSAPATPEFIETTEYLLFHNCEIDIQSISPSVMTSIRESLPEV